MVPIAVVKRAILPPLELEGPSGSDEDELPHMDHHRHIGPTLDGEHALRIARVEPFADHPVSELPRRFP